LRAAVTQGVPILPLGAILQEYLDQGRYSKSELRALVAKINRVDNRPIDLDALKLSD
jgi:hypothetical protein